ncbi:MAG: hypothetical protein AB7E80_03690 [Hyphomicrobiaceae bacterium]
MAETAVRPPNVGGWGGDCGAPPAFAGIGDAVGKETLGKAGIEGTGGRSEPGRGGGAMDAPVPEPGSGGGTAWGVAPVAALGRAGGSTRCAGSAFGLLAVTWDAFEPAGSAGKSPGFFSGRAASSEAVRSGASEVFACLA